MKSLVLILSLFSAPALAYEPGVYFDPYFAVGFNTVQGTAFIGGVDLGYALDENLSFGVGGHYAAGEDPANDREIGGGPFIGYSTFLNDFIGANVRQQVSYLDTFIPVTVNGKETHTTETGVASITSFGVHLMFTDNLALSAGYRMVLPLSNREIAEGRSGPSFGLSIGI